MKNMIKRLFLITISLLLWCYGFAQNLSVGNLESFLGGEPEKWAGTTAVTPFFIDKSDNFFYQFETPDGLDYYITIPSKKLNEKLFDRVKLAHQIDSLCGTQVDTSHLPIQNIEISSNLKLVFLFVNGKAVCYDRESQQLSLSNYIFENHQNYRPSTPESYSPNKKYAVYTKNHNVYLYNLVDSTEKQITTDACLNYSFAVYENNAGEWKDAARVVWLSNSKRFFIQRSDKRGINKMPILHSLGQRPFVTERIYEMPLDNTVENQEVFMYDVDMGQLKSIDIKKWNGQTLDLIPANKNVDFLLFLRKNRERNAIELGKINPINGNVEILIHDDIKPYMTEELFSVNLINDGKNIVWWSERSGRGHYYLYDINGNYIRALTSGNWTAGRIFNLDEKNKVMYIEGYGQDGDDNSPYYAKVNRVPLFKGKSSIITPEMATHMPVFSPSFSHFVDNYSRPDMEPVCCVRDNKGKVVVKLATPNLSNVYKEGWKMPESIKVLAADNETYLYGYMWKPFDFDPSKKYPIISHVYPGPQTEGIPYTFNITGVHRMALAQCGFIVVSFGHRGGSPLRDTKYHTFSHGNLRDYPLADDKYGLEQLAQQYNFIDTTRIGIIGHSGGACMAVVAMCTYPEFYKVGVASCGNYDSNIYNRWWGETHHGMSVIPTAMELVHNLKGHLLLVGCDEDSNVSFSSTVRLINSLEVANKDFDFLLLPGQGHEIASKLHNKYFQRKMLLYFKKYL